MGFAVFCVMICICPLGVRCDNGPKNRVGGPLRPCNDEAYLRSLSDPRTEGPVVLRAYGYNIDREMWSCDQVVSRWLRDTRMLIFRRVTSQSDDQSAFSVLQVSGSSYLWIVPLYEHSSEFQNYEGDPHNIAAFNAFLGSLSAAPSKPVDWEDIGRLYLALLGHDEAVLIKEGPSGDHCGADRQCRIAFADRVPHENDPYIRWTVIFSVARDRTPTRLTEVNREIVSSARGLAGPSRPTGQSSVDLLLHEPGHVP